VIQCARVPALGRKSVVRADSLGLLAVSGYLITVLRPVREPRLVWRRSASCALSMSEDWSLLAFVVPAA
jgi:hypothetical protein